MIIIDLQSPYSKNTIPSVDQFQQWFQQTLDYLGSEKQFELTVRVTDNAEIQQLNKEYRDKDKPTNILSFPFDIFSDEQLEIELLGDLVIASDIVVTEAGEQNKSTINHWAHLSIHGLLHLLGYDHIEEIEADEMESIEISVLALLDIDNPYLLPS